MDIMLYVSTPLRATTTLCTELGRVTCNRRRCDRRPRRTDRSTPDRSTQLLFLGAYRRDKKLGRSRSSTKYERQWVCCQCTIVDGEAMWDGTEDEVVEDIKVKGKLRVSEIAGQANF